MVQSGRTRSRGWRCRFVDCRLRPDRFSGTPSAVIANWRRCFSAAYRACEFSRIAVIQISGDHIGPHKRRPGTGRWIAGGKGDASCHECRLELQWISRLIRPPTKSPINVEQSRRCAVVKEPVQVIWFALDRFFAILACMRFRGLANRLFRPREQEDLREIEAPRSRGGNCVMWSANRMAAKAAAACPHGCIDG